MKHLLKRLVPVALLLGLLSCAHQEPAPVAAEPVATPAAAPKPEFAFGGHCAASVKANHFDTMGDPNITLEQGGKTYCFSSVKARDDFAKNPAKSAAAAERNWARRADTIR